MGLEELEGFMSWKDEEGGFLSARKSRLWRVMFVFDPQLMR